MNDAAKAFLYGPISLVAIYVAEGIEVFRPSTAQLLVMKLTAWRDDIDIADAALLLENIATNSVEETWAAIEPNIIPGQELKVRYALEDLWNSRR